MKKRGIYETAIKRLLDILAAALLIVAASPFLLATAILVRAKLGSPVFFRQARPGKDEKIFSLIKFRSMTNETGPDGKLLPDSKRLIPFGKFLRKTSIDELPELINIFRGDMSFVGPRPLSIYYLPHYSEEARRRHDVRPGLTGLAQVNGRNNLPWEERFAYDLEYVDHVSFVMDLKILLKTVSRVAKGSDVGVRGTTKVRDLGPYTIIKEEKTINGKTPQMTWPEIGSYFWLDREPERFSGELSLSWLPKVSDQAFTFSGRAAIDVVLRDLLKERSVGKAWIPSYSCVSMLQPFLDHEIPYGFYDVGRKDGAFFWDIPELKSGDAVLIMNYFGLDTGRTGEKIRQLKEAGAVVIEDITHSLLSERAAAPESDYLVASLRKWLEVPTGGWAGKREGSFADHPDLDGDAAVGERIGGMKDKYDYLCGKHEDKERFLAVLAKCDNDLIHVDRMLKLDGYSAGILAGTDVEAVRKRRRENAEILRDGLADLEPAGFGVLPFDSRRDTPLFYPVFLEHEKRESLRRYLIGRGIYCPVHWPEVMGAEAGVRANELSLICDQRYSEGDMREICDRIHEWAKAEA